RRLRPARRHGRSQHADRRGCLPQRRGIHPRLRRRRADRQHRGAGAVCCSRLRRIRIGGRMHADRDGAPSPSEEGSVTAAAAAVAVGGGPAAPDLAPPPRLALLSAIGTGLSFGLLAFVVLIAVLVIVVPAAVGGRSLTVLTSSMEPAYPPGTLVVVKPTAPGDI